MSPRIKSSRSRGSKKSKSKSQNSDAEVKIFDQEVSYDFSKQDAKNFNKYVKEQGHINFH